MKVALCLFGLPRCLEVSYVFYKHYIIDKLSCDTFVHTWNQSHGGHRFGIDVIPNSICFNYELTNIPSSPCYDMECSDYISNVIGAKKFEIGDYDDFSKKIGTHNIGGASEYTPSMYYSIMRSFQLLEEYEVLNGMEYDLVIMGRMDILFKSSIPTDEIEKSMTYGPYVGINREADAYPDNNKYSDGFIFGSRKFMKVYSDTFNTWLSNRSLLSEKTFMENLRYKGIEPLVTNTKIFLMEKYTDNEWYAIHHNKKS